MKKMITFILIVFTTTAFANTRLETLLNNMHSVKAHFTQRVEGGNQQVLMSSSGTMYLQRPGKFRWEVAKPYKQLLVVNEDKVWFYDIDLAQVSVRHVDLQKSNTPAVLLSDSNDHLLDTFNISEKDSKNGQEDFLLRAKKKDSSYKLIDITFKHDVIQGMQINDALGQITTLTFSNVELNHPLDMGLFNFKVPKGVDVVEE